jgi:hypothetical protein
VLGISAIEPVISVGAGQNDPGGIKVRQFLLHWVERQKAQTSQLPNVQLLPGVGKQQTENFRARLREQVMQQSRAHTSVYISTSLRRRLQTAIA